MDIINLYNLVTYIIIIYYFNGYRRLEYRLLQISTIYKYIGINY